MFAASADVGLHADTGWNARYKDKEKPSPIRYSEAPPGSAHKRKKLAEKKVEALRKKLQALSYTMQGQDPRRLFAMFDTDHESYKDRRWNYEEFKDAVVRGGQAGQISEEEQMQLFELVDTDRNNAITIDELNRVLRSG